MQTVTERAYGVLPLKRGEKEMLVFIVQRPDETWQLPKGHAEFGETPREAAERELLEETHLEVVQWLDHDPFVERYSFLRDTRPVYKEVQYFPALVRGTIILQPEEIKSGIWVAYEEMSDRVTFPELRKLTQDAANWIRAAQLGKK